jgi:NDP-sugar pyrophosphorylase family protein
MQCVILAAGKGTRMKELTHTTPKPMITVFGRPLLEYHLDFLPDVIDEVIFVVGYLGNKICEHFGSEWKGRKITYVEQTKLNGTAGAIHLAKEKVKGNFLVTMGDDLYCKEDLTALTQHPLSLLGYFTNNAEAFGLVTIDDSHHLLGVLERPHGFSEGLINTGAYMLNDAFFTYSPVQISDTEFGLPQTLVEMSQELPVKVEITKKWQPVGYPEDIPLAEQFLIRLQR